MICCRHQRTTEIEPIKGLSPSYGHRRSGLAVGIGVSRSGRRASCRPTPSRLRFYSPSPCCSLELTPRSLRAPRRAASTSFLDRAVDLVERAPIVPSCMACAVPDAPPSADRRHCVQLRCCSAYRRAGSLEPTRRRRACSEPRARRSLIAPSTSSSARRSCRRAGRAPFRPHRRAPTDVITFSFVAALPIAVPAHSG